MITMRPESRIYVAGHRGMVGSAIVRRLRADGFTNLVLRTHTELDLTDQTAVDAFFASERPEYVFLAAAKVGGIHANSTYPADFIRDNLAIQTNVIHSAWKHGARKLLFLGSSCIYPRDCPQPIKEEYLLTGPLEPTNEWYAIAKIAGIKLCQAYRKQYGFDAICAMPTNLYGPGDNYHPENSHVVPALIRRFHEAKLRGDKDVVIWGTGTPLREYHRGAAFFDPGRVEHVSGLGRGRHQHERGHGMRLGRGGRAAVRVRRHEHGLRLLEDRRAARLLGGDRDDLQGKRREGDERAD